jgi:hypothetical protein
VNSVWDWSRGFGGLCFFARGPYFLSRGFAGVSLKS